MNRIVIITGATNGYGLATAKKFKENGDTVIIASRNAEKVEETVKQYGFADGFKIDVTSVEDWKALKTFCIEKYGRVDVLVNNAGGGVAIEEVTKQSFENIDKAIALNLSSVMYGSKVIGEIMQQQKDGIIINISSVCARHCWGEWAVYAAAKAGVLNFSKGLYVEMRPFGVRVTCIIPAAASTGFQSGSGIDEVSQTLTTDDIANAVLFAANQPKGVVVEEMTVWGTSQDVQPL